ncbi:MAG: hypothetical protein HUK19_08715 [Fibrobacter sp.]|nr:hypothetical protein [Fibrobacter sp.]
MVFKKSFYTSVLTLALATLSWADPVTTEDISAGGAITRDRQLKEIGEILRGGRGAYFDIGMYYTPAPDQLPLKSVYGEHEGFAFRQHAAAFVSGRLAEHLHLGGLIWVDRSGWDGEDFVIYPSYNSFSLLRSDFTWGGVLTNSEADFSLAVGMHQQNVEHVGKVYEAEEDSLTFLWTHARWGFASAQVSLYQDHWRSMRFSLDLESREIYGGKSSGWQTYLPNVSVGLYNKKEDKDSISLTWEQNLYRQRLYGEVSFDLIEPGFNYAAIKYYPDPSRMLGFEATCTRRRQLGGASDLLWGGAVDLMFIRFAYNAAYDYRNFFGAKGTVLAEIKFSLASLDGLLFGRGGTKAAPMEKNTKTVKNKDQAPEENKTIQLRPEEEKVIEAKGIRYERKNPSRNGR